MSVNIFSLATRKGVREFDCTDCGCHVHSYGDTDTDILICRTCQYIGEHPQLPDEAKRLLRGETS